MKVDLIKLLSEYGCPDKGRAREETITNSSVTFLQLRDFLISSGEVFYEDGENNVYVASVRSGIFGMNRTIVAMQMLGTKINIAGYAKEGALKQGSWEKTYTQIEVFCQGKKSIKEKPKSKLKKTITLGLAAVAIVVVVGIGLMYGEIQQTQTATKAYNAAVSEYNEQVELYNHFVELTCIDNISGLPVVLESLATENEGFWANLLVVMGSNNKNIITTDTKTIQGMKEEVKSAVSLLKQITAPTGDFVMERLSTIENITGTQAVTQELDPDGLLGKEGGFSACVYFTVSYINPDEVVGDSIVAKGTDAGGAVEVYPTVQDAEARCEYLAGFNGTVLYSGSYAIVGTTVIRTSYKLTNEQQMELTNAITLALTSK